MNVIAAKKVRIGMILSLGTSLPIERRLQKEAHALMGAGFEVSLLLQRDNCKQEHCEKLDCGLQLYRAEVPKAALIRRFLEKISLIDRFWLLAIRNFVAEAKPDVLHAHDFSIVPTVLKIAKESKLPLIADLHENMPAALRAYRSNLDYLRRLKYAALYNYYLWRYHERRALRQCSRIIIVVPEAAERLLQDYKIPGEKICIVSNTEDEITFNNMCYDKKIISSYRNEWVVLYIGGVGPHRGIDTAIHAAAMAARAIPGFKLLIIGICQDRQSKEIVRIAEEANAGAFLELVNWVLPDKVSSYILTSNVCLVPHNVCEHTNTTVPHKLFQYMIMRKPVVVSDCRPLKRIVDEVKCGLVFKAGDSRDLARCFIELYQKGEGHMRQYGENGYHAACGKYSWKNAGISLINMYKDLLGLVD